MILIIMNEKEILDLLEEISKDILEYEAREKALLEYWLNQKVLD